ncbi:MAG: ArnT family glycosyltransferase [Phycisphaeraceae bacterium]
MSEHPGRTVNHFTPHRRSRRLLLAAPLMLALVVCGVRIAGPSDLSQNYDQSKTIAYTADIVLHGRWVLPRDNRGALTTKPPLVNWVGAVVAGSLQPLGFAWREWSLKMPTMLAGLLAVGVTTLAGYRLSICGQGELPGRSPPVYVACGAGLVLASSPFFVKHVYFLRPDMLAAALLACGWLAATVLLRDETKRPGAWAVALWLCMGLAALTKGFTALLLPLYILAAAKLVHGRFAAAQRTRWFIGLPAAVALGLSWPAMVWLVNREYLFEGLWGGQTAERFSGDGGWGSYFAGIGRDVLEMAGWPLEGVGPWYLAAIAVLFALPRRQWLGPVAGPAIVWCLCVWAIFLPLTHKGASYLLPMYPAMAVLAAVAWLNLPKIAPPGRSLVGLTLLAALCVGGALVWETKFSHAARRGEAGATMVDFAKRAQPHVKDQPVSFVALTNSPVITLLGRHPGNGPLEDADAPWVVELMPEKQVENAAEFEIISDAFQSRQTRYIDGPAVLILRER